jgi:hypothetical protein
LYKIAHELEYVLKRKTSEYIYSLGLQYTSQSEVDINEYFKNIIIPLNLNEIVSMISFKAIDIEKKGIIKLENFIIVIDSFRKDFNSSIKEILEMKIDSKLLKENCIRLNHILRENHINDVFTYTIYKDYCIDSFELIRSIKNIQTNSSNESLYNLILKNDIDINYITNFLRRKDGRIYNQDFDKLMFKNDDKYLNVEDLINSSNKNSNTNKIDSNDDKKDGINTNEPYSEQYFSNFFNGTNIKILKYDRFNLDESKIYWISKFKGLLNSIKLTPKMVFSVTICKKENERSIDNNIKSSDKINLDHLKKKLKILFPVNLVSANDINNFVDALDINRDRSINQKDFLEIMDDIKEFNVEVDNFGVSFNKTNLNEHFFKNMNDKSKSTIFYNTLPIKGNYETLSKINKELNENEEEIQKIKNLKDNEKIKSNDLQKSINKLEKSKENNLNAEIKDDLRNNEFMKKFIKEIEVFESGDWALIEILENITFLNTSKKQNFITCNELLLLYLLPKFHPTITKKDLFAFCKILDSNNKGFVTFKDMYIFLLEHLYHKSVKLSLKEVVYEIEINCNKSIEEYIYSVFGSDSSLQILSFMNFTKFLLDKFSLPPQIIKKIYYDFIEKYNRQITVADLIDSFKDYSFINKTQYKENENNDIHIIDKNYFEEKIKEFVLELSKSFPVNKKSEGNNYYTLEDSLVKYLNFKENETLELSEFRELLVKPLNLEYSLSISIFQILKSFSGKSYIYLKDLINFLDSYLMINQMGDLKNLDNIEMLMLDPFYICKLIELKGSELKFCLESLPYSSKYVSTLEFRRTLEDFYPFYPSKALYFLALSLEKAIIKTSFNNQQINKVDVKKISGKSTLNVLIEFLHKFSSKNNFSEKLIFKYLASICDFYDEDQDYKKFEIKSLDMAKNGINCLVNRHLSKNNIVNINEHTSFFNYKLKFSNEVSEKLFFYLSGSNKELNNNGTYLISDLCSNVDFYRINIHDVQVVVDNSSNIGNFNFKRTKVIDFVERLMQIKNINTSLDKLKLNVNSQKCIISVLELNYVLNNDYKTFMCYNKKNSNFNMSENEFKSSLKNFLNLIDNNKKGYLEYLEMLSNLNNLIEGFEIPILLHIKYLSICKKNEFSNVKNYLVFKGLSSNQYLSFDEFNSTFKQEMLKDKILAVNIFDRLKENKGKFFGLMLVENFTGLIFSKEDDIQETTNIKETQEDFKIKEFISLYSDFIIFCISKNKFTQQMNKFGKIKSQQLVSIFSEEIDDYFDYFDNVKDNNSTLKKTKNMQCQNKEKILKDLSEFAIYFTKFGNNLFDVLSFISFIDSHFFVLNMKEFKDYNFKSLKKRILEKNSDLFSLLENNKSTKEKYCIDLQVLIKKGVNIEKLNLDLNIYDYTQIISPLLEINNFETFSLFYFSLFDNSNNTFSNVNNLQEIKVKIMKTLNLLDVELKEDNNPDEIEKRDNMASKQIPNLLLLKRKIYEELIKYDNNPEAFFKNIDKNQDGFIDREEFFFLLDYLIKDEINKAQKLEIIKLVDTNNNDKIDYMEFLFYLDQISNSKGAFKDSKKSKTINQKKTEKKIKKEIKIKDEEIENEEEIDDQIDKKTNDLVVKKTTSKMVLINIFVSKYLVTKENLTSLYKKNFEVKEKLELNGVNISELDRLYIEIQKVIINEFLSKNCIEKLLYDIKSIELKSEYIDYQMNENSHIINVMDLINVISKKHDLKSIIDQIGEEEIEFEILNDLIDSFFISKNDKKERNISDYFRREKIIDVYFFMTKSLTYNILNKESVIKEIKYIDKQNEKQDENQKEKKKIKTPSQLSKSPSIISKNEVNNKFYMKDYKYKDQDFFIRRYLENGKEKEQKYKTILLSEEAALKKCEELYHECETTFTDPEFGGQNLCAKSLYFDATPKGSLPPSSIDWVRMEYISKNPVFLNEGANANDVMQGALGNCWFISALSVIATKDHLLRGEYNEDILKGKIISNDALKLIQTGIFPPIFHGFRHKKIFCFKFFKNNNWVWVIIDDKLPVQKQQKRLIYGKCFSSNEFWVPLIEKAYAKLHGCYQSLVSGFIDDGLVDLTGLVAEKVMIENDNKSNRENIENLWNRLIDDLSRDKLNKENIDKKEIEKSNTIIESKFFSKNNTMLGCSIDAKQKGNEHEVIYNNNKCGVLAGHAYSILDVIEIPNKNSSSKRKTSRLLRVRNPWGFKEWNGKWSDTSNEIDIFKDIIQKKLNDRYKDDNEKVTLDEEDGTFLIGFKDFRNIFNKLYICKDFDYGYTGISFIDEWDDNSSGGIPISNTEKENKAWSNNPQYYVKLSKKTKFYISLQQTDGRMYYDTFPFKNYTNKCNIIIVRTKGNQALTNFDSNNIVTISSIKMHRENAIYITLDPGEYVIVPSILNENNKKSKGKFWLNLYINEMYIKEKLKITDFDQSNINECFKNTIISKINGDKKNKCKIN